MRANRISIIFGTRPEAIKLCPLIRAMRREQTLEPHVCVTGQHREMLAQVLEAFEIEPDVDLGLMQPKQSLAGLTARAIEAIDRYLHEISPDLVIAQGDTTTAFCAALASFYRGIPVGHVEAGLRTGNKLSPFPEEVNRVLTSRLADFHFAPTNWARANLLKEGVSRERIYLTGNTVIDALHFAVAKVHANPPEIPGLPTDIKTKPLVLITGHRRENFGERFQELCNGIVLAASDFPEVQFVYPVHLNPQVREPVFRLLGGRHNIHLIEPLSYLPFVSLMDRAKLILTDSGGVQEEAPSLGKPVLVMRDTTERPEAVEAGTVRLVGTDSQRIREQVRILLTDEAAYNQMARSINPYGDGRACTRIVQACNSILQPSTAGGQAMSPLYESAAAKGM